MRPHNTRLTNMRVFLHFFTRHHFNRRHPRVNMKGMSGHLRVLSQHHTSFVQIIFHPIRRPQDRLVRDNCHIIRQLNRLHRVDTNHYNRITSFINRRIVRHPTTTGGLTPSRIRHLSTINTFMGLHSTRITRRLLLTPLTSMTITTRGLLTVRDNFRTRVNRRHLNR